MAVRLSVLVLRPPGGGSTWHAHSDDLLGHLLGRPGLDVTLLERLPDAAEDSTESLALESIGGHIACLAWQDPAEVMADLDRAGRPMLRRPHAGDPHDEAPAKPPSVSATSQESIRQGRMYFFDMRRQDGVPAVLGALQGLLRTLQVPTFQIGSPSESAPPRLNSSATLDPAPRPAPPAPVSPPTLKSRPETRVAPSQSDALDRLVDELDAFDS